MKSVMATKTRKGLSLSIASSTLGAAAPIRWELSLLLGSMLTMGVVQAQQTGTTATPPPLVFRGVTVVDVAHGTLIPDQTVVIVGNRIRTIAPAGNVRLSDSPAGAQVVEAHGLYLIPGLWDLHVHPHFYGPAPDVAYPLFLAAGVTGIRDAHFGGAGVGLDGAPPQMTLAMAIQWRREILAGTRVGPPRQLLNGLPINSRDMPECADDAESAAVCVADTASARRMVDSLQQAGADMIKTYNLSRSMYFVVAAEARRLGIPFGGHVGEPLSGRRQGRIPAPSAIEASDSGARILDHDNTAGGLDTLCLAWAAASVARCQPVAERFRRNNTWWVPTLTNGSAGKEFLESPFRQPGRPASAVIYRQLLAFSCAFVNDAVLPRALFDTATTRAIRTSQADSLGLLRLAARVGVPILAGTDAVTASGGGRLAGYMLHAELAMYVSEGLTPLEALRAATLNPAIMLRATDSLGTVAPGKLADLVVLEADPLEDIINTTTIRAVVANGRYFDRAALDGLLTKVRGQLNMSGPCQP